MMQENDKEIERLKKIIEKLWIQTQLYIPLSYVPDSYTYEQAIKNLWQKFKTENKL